MNNMCKTQYYGFHSIEFLLSDKIVILNINIL